MDSLYRKCRQNLAGFIFGAILGFTVITCADLLTSPPILAELPVSLQHYLKKIYDNFGMIEVIESTPNGSRIGKKGEMLHVVTGGKYYHCENIDGDTTWYCVELTNLI